MKGFDSRVEEVGPVCAGCRGPGAARTPDLPFGFLWPETIISADSVYSFPTVEAVFAWWGVRTATGHRTVRMESEMC